jgi:hypothetical protein
MTTHSIDELTKAAEMVKWLRDPKTLNIAIGHEAADLILSLSGRVEKAEAALTEITTLANYARPEEKIGYAINLANETLIRNLIPGDKP